MYESVLRNVAVKCHRIKGCIVRRRELLNDTPFFMSNLAIYMIFLIFLVDSLLFCRAVKILVEIRQFPFEVNGTYICLCFII